LCLDTREDTHHGRGKVFVPCRNPREKGVPVVSCCRLKFEKPLKEREGDKFLWEKCKQCGKGGGRKGIGGEAQGGDNAQVDEKKGRPG